MKSIKCSEELVFALVCPVGVNIDLVENKFQEIFKEFGYTVEVIHISKLVQKVCNDDYSEGLSDEVSRIDQAMSQCTDLRSDAGEQNYCAQLAIKDICEKRANRKEKNKTVYLVRSRPPSSEVQHYSILSCHQIL